MDSTKLLTQWLNNIAPMLLYPHCYRFVAVFSFYGHASKIFIVPASTEIF